MLHRSEEAFRWLFDIIAEGDLKVARFIVEELSIYSSNEQLLKQMQSAVAQFGDEELTSLFCRFWL